MANSAIGVVVYGTSVTGSGSTADGQSTRLTITQTSHGFTPGTVVYRSTSGNYQKARRIASRPPMPLVWSKVRQPPTLLFL